MMIFLKIASGNFWIFCVKIIEFIFKKSTTKRSYRRPFGPISLEPILVLFEIQKQFLLILIEEGQ